MPDSPMSPSSMPVVSPAKDARYRTELPPLWKDLPPGIRQHLQNEQTECAKLGGEMTEQWAICCEPGTDCSKDLLQEEHQRNHDDAMAHGTMKKGSAVLVGALVVGGIAYALLRNR